MAEKLDVDARHEREEPEQGRKERPLRSRHRHQRRLEDLLSNAASSERGQSETGDIVVPVPCIHNPPSTILLPRVWYTRVVST